MALAVAYLRGRALSGVGLSTVEAFDLANLLAGDGKTDLTHGDVAEALDLSFSQVQRRRRSYSDPRLVGDPDQPLLRRISGAGRRPTVVELVEVADPNQLAFEALVAEASAGQPGVRKPARGGYVEDDEQAMRRAMAERFERMCRSGKWTLEEAYADIVEDVERGDYGPWFVDASTGAVDKSVEAPFFGWARSADAPRARHLAAPPSEDPPRSFERQGVQGDGSFAPSKSDAREGGSTPEPSSPRSEALPGAPNLHSPAHAQPAEPEGDGLSARDAEPLAPLPVEADLNGLGRDEESNRAWEGTSGGAGRRQGAGRDRMPRHPQGSRARRPARVEPDLYVSQPAPAGSADRREDEAQAAVLRQRLVAMKLLHRRKVASVAELADALGTLRSVYGSRNTAARIVAAALFSVPSGRNEGAARPSERRGFPGAAFYLALEPRRAVRTDWWLRSVEEGWNGVPLWSELAGWTPLIEPSPMLTRYGDDDDDATLHRRWAEGEARRAEERRQRELEGLWDRRETEPGALTTWAVRAGKLPWDAMCVLADHGGDFLRTLGKWRGAARRGSERCLDALDGLDDLVQRGLDAEARKRKRLERKLRKMAAKAQTAERFRGRR